MRLTTNEPPQSTPPQRAASTCRRRIPTRRLGLIAVAVTCAMVAAACGSRLPDDVLAQIDEAAFNRSAGPAPSTDSAAGPGAAQTDTVENAGGNETGGTAPSDTAPGAADQGGGATSPDATAPTGPAGGGATNENCSGGASDTGVTDSEIKVASIVTASGPLPGATEGAYRGAAAYLAKTNAEGGVCGRQITLLKGDDGLDPQRARGEFLRLEPNVLAFVGSFAVADSGYIDKIEETGVPYVGITIDPAGRELPNVVPVYEQGVLHSGPFEYYRQTYPDAKNVGFMFADVGGVRDNVPGFVEGWKRAGFNVVYNSAASPAQVDFTSDIINMRQANVDLLYLFAFEVSMHVRMARNMRQQGWEPKVKVSNIGYNSALIDLLGPIADGWTAHMQHLPMLNPDEPARSPALAEFLTWHERLFPGTPIDLFPVTAWGDAARFVEALRKAGGDPKRAAIIDGVANAPETNGGGIWAPAFPAKHQGVSCFVIARVTDQTWTREHPASGFECGMGEQFRF